MQSGGVSGGRGEKSDGRTVCGDWTNAAPFSGKTFGGGADGNRGDSEQQHKLPPRIPSHNIRSNYCSR